MGRATDLDRLYALLDALSDRHGGPRRLEHCDGYMDWPDRGVYFFFSHEETRTDDEQPRLTRIGTHAVSEGSQTSLWNRLRTHRGAMRGSYEGGGNHRGSVFRKRVGEALIERDDLHDDYPDWGTGNSARRDRRMRELEMEQHVSAYIRDLPFLWLGVDDEPSPESRRAYIERNAIALVSNYDKPPIDPRADAWLGNQSPVEEIRDSGLWNINHVDETYDPAFLDILEDRLEEPAAATSTDTGHLSGSTEGSTPNGDYADSSAAGNPSDRGADSFDAVWETLLEYADSRSTVATLSRGNENQLRRGTDAIEVRNLETDQWREIPREDFQFAYSILQDTGELTLDDIEPDLAGRKSMVTAILARGLALDYDHRPLTVHHE